ncbi:MAG: D-sedoheptulose 7-phosphate isomerase [Rhodospirillaceae bacterium]|nr:D-sedoheptulose 7-phosphate isomerase [Rhodospirillaceae bacterium]MBL6941263.1 D-sedoheptulose 7-phosphate isomerase [Rhodospirillales bacterium]
MDLNAYLQAEMDAHAEAFALTREMIAEPFAQLLGACVSAHSKGGKIVFFGNGGSAADAQHLATELTVRYIKDRAPIPAISLATDTSSLTAIGNDFGFDDLFARQVEALVGKDDVVIAISTSGNSENVIRALNMAKNKGAVAAGFSGRDGGRMTGLAAPLITVPCAETARIQEMHILIGHMLCGALEKELGLL